MTAERDRLHIVPSQVLRGDEDPYVIWNAAVEATLRAVRTDLAANYWDTEERLRIAEAVCEAAMVYHDVGPKSLRDALDRWDAIREASDDRA